MKKSLLAAGLAAALLAPQVAGAEGFGIVEWSAEGIAMGGARMFAEGDAANVAYNPASITKIQGKAMKWSATYISPHGRYDAKKRELVDLPNGQKVPAPNSSDEIESARNRVRPGWAPASYYVRQIDEKNWIGMGNFPRFAMASEFESGTVAASNNKLAKLNGMSFTPVYAHKFDKKWSAAVGAEINYVGLELQKELLGKTPMQVEGESWAMGWNAAANYAFDDKNEIGVVYRSKITHSLEADDVKLSGNDVADAYGVVTLPDTWSIGYNHKFDKKTRIELNATRTNWSTYDALDIAFSNQTGIGAMLPDVAPSPKNWEDGWRYAIGIEHKLSDKYSLMAGFAYDGSCIPYDGGDFIVPTGNRRTYSLGMQYHDKDQTLALAAGYMDVGSLDFKGQATDMYDSVHTHDNYVKIYSISYQRNF